MTEAEFNAVFKKAFPILYKIAYRITNSGEAAEDMCQDAFFRLHEKQMVFPNKDEAVYWLIRVVKNAALNYAKRKQREWKAYQKVFKEEPKQIETGEKELVRKETQDEVSRALGTLPDNLRVVLVLKEYGGLNYKEIGRALGISEGNVKIRVFRAREKLAAALREMDVGILETENVRRRNETKLS